MRRAVAVIVLFTAIGRAQAPKQISLIVTGGTVVTMDASRRVLAPGATDCREEDDDGDCATHVR
jgi:hypothetical protein